MFHLSGIYITFKGEGHVSFEDHDYYAGEMKMYSTSEQYFKETYSLYSPGECAVVTSFWFLE